MTRAVHRQPLWLVLLLSALVLPACPPQEAEQAHKETTVPVATAPVTAGTITREIRRTGEVRAEVEVRVFSQVPDRILDLRVEEGDEVVKNQVLAIIQSEALAAGVAQAAASLESARVQQEKTRDDLARADKLLTSNVTSAAQVDALRKGLAAAEAQVRSLEAVVEQAATRQRQSLVRAPLSGVVGTRHLSRGDLAAPQIPIVTLVQIDRVKVVLQATELDLPYLAADTPVQIRVAAWPGEVFAGKVSRVSPVIDPLTRHAQVEVLLDNPGHRLKPGMLADVSVVLEQRQNVTLAPLFALLLAEGTDERGRPRYHAFVVEQGRAHKREIRVGLLEGGRIEVQQGLKPGEELVVRGQQLLEQDSPVEVVSRTAPDGVPREATEEGAAPAPTRAEGASPGGARP